MRFLSLFSGIEAASVAWAPLGWQCAAVAEIDGAASAVLKHHFPDVPNLGDITRITDQQIAYLGHLDVVIGGFPCQDLSVAGQRKGLKHNGENTRSGLFFDAARLVFVARERCGARWAVIENVPGLFSMHHGRDFAAVVGALAGAEFDIPRNGWRNSGFALGPERLVEWGVLDAQFWGLAQRRKRVFFVVDFGDWTRRGPLFSQPHRLLWHSPPRRKAGEDAARPIAAGSPSSGGYRNDVDTAENLIAGTLGTDLDQGATFQSAKAGNLIAATLDAASGRSRGAGTPLGMIVPEMAGTLKGYGGNNTSGPINVATAVNALGAPHGRQDFESETFVATTEAVAFKASHFTRGKDGAPSELAPPLSADADKGDQDTLICFDTTQVTHPENRANPQPGDPAHALNSAGHPPAVAYRTSGNCGAWETGDTTDALTTATDPNSHVIAFSSKDHGADAGDISSTLRAGGHANSHANAGVPPAIAFAMRGREGGAMPESHDAVSALRSASGGSTRDFVATTKVRRLLPVECERLQGFPDNFTRIPIRHFKSKRVTKLRPADRWERDADNGWWLMQADGPRYKQLGNSMATTVVRWIGEQIMRAEEEGRA